MRAEARLEVLESEEGNPCPDLRPCDRHDEITPLRLETPVPLRSSPSEGDRPIVASTPSRELDRRAPTLPRSNGLPYEEHESAVTSRDEQGTSTSDVAAEKEGSGKLPGNLPLYSRRWRLRWFLPAAARRDERDKQASEKTAASHSSEFAPSQRRSGTHPPTDPGTM